MTVTQTWVQEITSICRRHGVGLCYLFGSQVSGATDQFSDVDVGVVFLRNEDSGVRLAALEKDLRPLFAPLELDLVPLAQASCQMKYLVVRDGQLVYCTTDDLRADFEEQVSREWLDFEPVISRFNRDMVEGILTGRHA